MSKLQAIFRLCLPISILLACHQEASAETVQLSESQLVEYVRQLEGAAMPLPRVSIVGTPSGFTADPGVLQFALSGTNRRVGDKHPNFDGSFAVTYGFGNPDDAIGAEVSTIISSISGDEEGMKDFPKGFGNAGFFDIKLSHRDEIGQAVISGALEAGYLGPWGSAKNSDPTYTAALSGVTPIQPWGDHIFTLMGTVGYGSNISNQGDTAGAFVAFGLGLNSRVSFSTAWMGDRAVIGTTIWLREQGDPRVNIALDDAFETKGERRVIFDVAWAFDTNKWWSQ